MGTNANEVILYKELFELWCTIDQDLLSSDDFTVRGNGETAASAPF